MSTDQYTFDNIAGQAATLEVNSTDTHLVITWGGLTITDQSGDVGFWSGFNSAPSRAGAKGAARNAAERAYARSVVEHEIFAHIQYLQAEIASRD